MYFITFRPLVGNDKVVPFSTPHEYSLNTLQFRLKVLKDHGFLEIFGKKRNAAVGESLERYLGLQIDSSRSSDWGVYELKTSSKGVNSKISLFNITLNYQKGYSARNIVLEYGKPHHSKHLNKSVIRLDWEIVHSMKPMNKLYSKIPTKEGPLTINHGVKVIAIVNREDLKKWLEIKFKNLVLINVENLKIEQKNGFIIKNAILLENTSFESFIKLIHSNQVKLSFKMMLILPKTPDEKFNNRGTGFRTTYKVLTDLYNSKKTIL